MPPLRAPRIAAPFRRRDDFLTPASGDEAFGACHDDTFPSFIIIASSKAGEAECGEMSTPTVTAAHSYFAG